MVLLLLCSTFSFTACDRDDLNTDQYGNEISVLSFGPCPVLRGGILSFKGSNLDQITEVDLPGADPITAINVVQAGTKSEINIEVPAEKCDTGIVVLKTAKGGEIRTLTPITYTETIRFDNMFVGTEGNLDGAVGQTLTINGDYLNNVHTVIFANGVEVPETEFTTHTRYQIQVVIPSQARTGRIQLSDGSNTLYPEPTLAIALPEVTKLDPTTVKAGQTITVTGTSLDQVATISLKGATVDTTEIERAADGKSLSFKVPATATDGEVTLNLYSGVEIPAGSITTVVPTDLSYAPAPVKNGATITVSGKDLDLITKFLFPNGDKGIEVDAVYKDGKISATVPAGAQPGNLTLKLANGKTVSLEYKLVEPTVTKFAPAVVTAGAKIAIIGTNLDLVENISFPGDAAQKATDLKVNDAGTTATVTVPAAAYGTGCTLNLKNGTTVEVKSGLTINAATMPAINGTPSGTPGEYVTVTGKNFNNIESLSIGTTKVTKYKDKENATMTFQIPATLASGSYDFTAVQPDGTKVTLGKFTVKSAETDLATDLGYKTMGGAAITYPFNFTWGDDGRFRIMKADLKKIGVKVGSKLIFYKETSATGQVQINNANWSALTTVSDWNGNTNQVVYTFDAAAMECVNSVSDGWSDTAFILQGDLKSVTKIAVLP